MTTLNGNMAFTTREKNTSDLTARTKNVSRTILGRILTPDGFQVLVGENEDQRLIWQAEGESQWQARTKN